MKRFALTAIGIDKPGILALLAKALYDRGCLIEASTMTLVDDQFAVILILSAPGEDEGGLSSYVKKVEKAADISIAIKEIPHGPAKKSFPGNYVITLHGAQSAEAVYKTADLLARYNINITDLETKLLAAKTHVMLIEVLIPKGADMKAFGSELRALSESLGVTIKLKTAADFEPL